MACTGGDRPERLTKLVARPSPRILHFFHASCPAFPMLKKIALVLLVLFVGIQFFRPEKNLSAAPPGKDDFMVRFPPPPEVKRLLEVACYDCHSNHTRYPWYAQIQPVGWWLADHVRDGKAELNLSEFGALTDRRKGSKLETMYDEASERHMPLKSYTFVHRDAKLTDAQIQLLCDWFESVRDQLPEPE